MIAQLLIASMSITESVQTPTIEPFIVGERASAVSPDDRASIKAATAPYGSVWMILVGDLMFVSPPTLQATAYFVPTVTSSVLRRGKAMGLYQEKLPEPAPGYEWRSNHEFTEWAQVAAQGKSFGMTLGKPRGLDRPFSVSGQVSDVDLVAIVRFVRSSPSKPGKRIENADGSVSLEGGDKVDGDNPIISVVAKGDCYVEVSTTRRPGAGQSIEILHGKDGWQLFAVSDWFA